MLGYEGWISPYLDDHEAGSSIIRRTKIDIGLVVGDVKAGHGSGGGAAEAEESADGRFHDCCRVTYAVKGKSR